jgi:3-dehydroquinate dehydratase
VKNREPFRALSVLEDICITSVIGQGVDGYRVALERLKGVM